jgi:hypothetical protein
VTEYPDGSPVSFIGLPGSGLAIGDRGQVLCTTGRGAHVKWASGQRAGAVTLEDVDDLVPAARHTAVGSAAPAASDALDEVGVPSHLGLAHLCALRGPDAVLTAIASTHAQELAKVAREVRNYAEERVAASPGIGQVIAQLDEEEGAELVRLATIAIIRDTFGLTDG